MISAPPRKRAYSAPPTWAKRVKPSPAVKAFVKRAVAHASELKTLLTSQGGTISAVTGNFYLLNPMVQGVTADARIGRDVKNETLNIRVALYLAAATTDGDIVRIIVLKDKEARGTAPVVADILNFTAGSALAQVVSPLNQSNVDRFKIMYDKTFTLEPTVYNTTTTSTGGRWKTLDLDLKDGAMTRYFNTSVGTIADIDSGSLYLFAVANNSSTQITLGSLLNFRDP